MMKKIPNLKKKVDVVKFPLFFNGLFFGLPGIIYPRNSHFKIHGFLSSILMPQKRSVKFTNQQKNYESRSVSKNDPPVKLSYMDVSKNRGKPPKWMVKIMETPIKMDDLGIPLFSETPISTSIMRPFSEVSIISFFPFGSRYVGQPFPGKGQFFFATAGTGNHVLPIPASRTPAEPGGVVTSLRSIDPLLDFHRTVEIPGGNCFAENPGGQQRSSRSGKVDGLLDVRGSRWFCEFGGFGARVFSEVGSWWSKLSWGSPKKYAQKQHVGSWASKNKNAEIRETNSSPLKIGPRAPQKGTSICCFKECVTLPIHGSLRWSPLCKTLPFLFKMVVRWSLLRSWCVPGEHHRP